MLGMKGSLCAWGRGEGEWWERRGTWDFSLPVTEATGECVLESDIADLHFKRFTLACMVMI